MVAEGAHSSLKHKTDKSTEVNAILESFTLLKFDIMGFLFCSL